MVVVFLEWYAVPTCITGAKKIVHKPTNEPDIKPDPMRCVPRCLDEWLGNGLCDPECNVTACSFDSGDCTPESIARVERDTMFYECYLPYGALIYAIKAFMVFIDALSVFYFVLLRFKMRKAFNIKASCCTSYGEVGEYVEDTICMTSCYCCAMAQMSAQTDTQLEYCCQGKAPADLNSSVVSAV